MSSGELTYERALEVLGIEEETSDGDARRAYLRLVKKHRPEQDPEGFRRVREAYECLQRLSPLKAVLRQHAAARRDAQANDTTSGTPIADRSPTPGDAVNPEPVRSAEDDARPEDATKADETSFLAYAERAERLEEEQSKAAAIGELERAVAALPESRQARWALYWALMDDNREEDALRVLLDGVEAGMDELESAVVRNHAHAAPARLVSAIVADPARKAEALPLLVAQHRFKEAAAVAIQILEEDRDIDGGTAGVDVHAVLTTLAGLVGKGMPKRSRELSELFGQWLSQQRPGTIPTHVIARWALVRELIASEPWMDESLSKAIGRTLATDDDSHIARAMTAYGDRDREAANREVEKLQRSAPALFTAYGQGLRSHAGNLAPMRNWGFGGKIFLYVAVTVIIRLVASAFSGSDDARPYAPPSRPVAQEAPPELEPPPDLSAKITELDSVARGLANTEVTVLTPHMLRGFRTGDCADGYEAAVALQAMLPQVDGQPELTRRMTEALVLYNQECPGGRIRLADEK